MDVLNWIAGQEVAAAEWFEKLRPTDGTVSARVARSRAADVDRAIGAAAAAQAKWAETPAVQRGMILHAIVDQLQAERDSVAQVVAEETGKSPKDALGEVGGAAALGLFYASEGQRLYARTTTSGVENRTAMTVRHPIGVAGLIIAANTPIANVAWKVFPALICGNTAVLKAAEDTPATAALFARIAHKAGLPPGVLNVIQGFGEEAGAPLVADPRVGVVSFTGSTAVGRRIAVACGERLARVSLELGGKNPLVVCDDANLDKALHWTLASAFSNAGQRCASASRIIVFDSVYDEFRDRLVAQAERLLVGPTNEDFYGPVINQRQLDRMLASVDAAVKRGGKLLCGGRRLEDESHRRGCYVGPTLLEQVSPDDPISLTELFGPIACLYRVSSFAEAVELANRSPYGLTASIHTRDLHRAMRFTQLVQAGVASVNGGTFGSEPHMPFGGFKSSGNGTREPGSEALDVYSELRDVYLNIDPGAV